MIVLGATGLTGCSSIIIYIEVIELAYLVHTGKINVVEFCLCKFIN